MMESGESGPSGGVGQREISDETPIHRYVDAEGTSAHADFIAWVDAHSDGFVLNTGSAGGAVLHRAKCMDITWSDYGESRMTRSEKICCTDRSTLEHYSIRRFGTRSAECGTCL